MADRSARSAAGIRRSHGRIQFPLHKSLIRFRIVFEGAGEGRLPLLFRLAFVGAVGGRGRVDDAATRPTYSREFAS